MLRSYSLRFHHSRPAAFGHPGEFASFPASVAHQRDESRRQHMHRAHPARHGTHDPTRVDCGGAACRQASAARRKRIPAA